MKDTVSRGPRFQHDNDDYSITTGQIEYAEQTKLYLKIFRTAHQTKADILGPCYDALGDNAWQILCEIHLHNLEAVPIGIGDIQKSIGLSATITARYLDILRSEQLLRGSGPDGRLDTRNLKLTDFGRSQVAIINKRVGEAIASLFMHS